MNDADIVAKSVEKTHIWLNELSDELGGEDRQAANRLLRRHVSAGEMDDVAAVFPEQMRPLLAG